APSTAAYCGRNGQGLVSCFSQDQDIHCRSETATCVSSSELLARLEPRREGMEPPQTPGDEITSGKDQSRNEEDRAPKTNKNAAQPAPTTRDIFSLLCRRTFVTVYRGQARANPQSPASPRPP